MKDLKKVSVAMSMDKLWWKNKGAFKYLGVTATF